MKSWLRLALAACAFLTSPARASGDILVAPTRLVLNTSTGGEVVVSNIGDKTTTYRVSLVLRRMEPTGQIKPVEEAQASPLDTAALSMITYAPRRIVLAPQQPQTVRIGVRAPPGTAPGEYRAHLMFRAVPDAPDAPAAPTAAPATTSARTDGMTVQLTAIYGVAIPVIIRVGAVDGSASLANAQLARDGTVTADLVRSGNRSVYGTLDVLTDGSSKPIATMKGLAAYPEVTRRAIALKLPRDQVASAKGALTLRFTETDPAARGSVVETRIARAN